MKLKTKLLLLAAFFALAIPLIFTGNAGAMYLTDSTKEVSTGVYDNPQDGVCVVGLKFDGTLDVNTSITNYKDCIVYTTSAIKALGQTACTGGTGNDGYKHAWSTSICVDNVTDKNPISRVDLDNTTAMCKSKGGTVITTGLCVAYGWLYMNAKAGETMPYRDTISPSGYKGRTSSDNLGFCYTSMRMTSASGYNTANNGGCPSYHNVSTTANSGEWNAGTDGVLYQSQASYDAGLGWSFASSQCLYAYGVVGYVNAAIVNAAGTTTKTAGTFVDGTSGGPTAYTTQGDCLAAGYSWDNWLPYGDGSGTGGNASTITVPTTLTSSIVKLDAITAIASGGGKYYSGTGSVCTKCHTDQSRSYFERYKPGFIETGHKLAGDTDPWTTIGDEWNEKGVQCEICHATGKPTAQDVGIVIYPDGDANAGKPRAASGHNQTEYGSHLINVCFYCHGTMPGSGNPAAQIPVSSGEFALTSKNLAPIGNQFLNSPHAQFTGLNTKLDLIKKANYNSSFVGYICRTPLGAYSSTTTYVGVNQSQCENVATGSNIPSGLMSWPGGKWFTGSTNPTVAAACYDSALTCAQRGFSGAGGSSNYGFAWSSSYDSYAQPWGAVTTNGGAGICGGIGSGSIVTTAYQSGAAVKIPNLDTFVNSDCTNAGDGSSTSGAAGFWVREGEAAGTSIPSGGSAAMAPSDQGNCMTCHDVHWSLDSTDPEAEPIRRECITCHQNSGTSASSAPQVDISVIAHPSSAGTPLEHAGTDPDESCEICHMPKLTSDGSPMHLWRINTSASYETAGTTAANLDADNKAWVDLERACRQCHGPAGPAVHQFSTTALSTFAGIMHDGGGAPTTDCATCHKKNIATMNHPVATGTPATCITCHTEPGTPISIDASCGACHGGSAGPSATQNGAPYISNSNLSTYAENMHINTAPKASFTFDISYFTVTLTDTSTDDSIFPENAVKVKWGDGTSSTGNAGSVFSHTYATADKFDIVYTATDSDGLKNSKTKTVAVKFSITANISSALSTDAKFILKKNGITIRTGTGTDSYVFSNLRPGTYKVKVKKLDYTFDGDDVTDGNQNPITVIIGTSDETVTFTHTP
ncbi:MAG: hypothetical protein HZB30_05915 [Nitrospirae bacterium]|nr:hypothetical protein [Nitrospirota bacterium]